MKPTIFADALTMQQLARDLERIVRGSGPSPAELDTAPILTGWHLHLAQAPVLTGYVAGHPERRDGPVVTSQLYAIDLEERAWARTMSRWYRLRP